MIPLLDAGQLRQADAYTIQHEPVSSLKLMERASVAFVKVFMNRFPDKQQTITIYCGTGNNGGDGLAIARLLHQQKYEHVQIVIARFGKKSTADFDANLKKIKQTDIACTELFPGEQPPADNSLLVIDALLGSGLNKPLQSDYARLVKHLNGLNKKVVAVDVPTGLFAEGETPANAVIFKADLVITFQQPKISFLLPESGPYMKQWVMVDIGLDEQFIRSLNPPCQFVQNQDISTMLKPRPRFSNKGTFGHALLIAGQPETMGAALLCASACAYAGAGLTTACIPQSGLTALNTAHPEIMAIVREDKKQPDISWDKFTAIGIGPGLGKEKGARKLLAILFKNYKKPMVIDADALNILSADPDLFKHIPAKSILTPHLKEFDRLFGEHASWWQRIQTAIGKAAEYQIYIVLKNDYTLTITPERKVYFNSTSNAAMASGGMGDVLTGIITSLLAQKYTPEQACIMGVYIHGMAGDELALPNKMMVVLPGKLAMQLPETMAALLR